MGLPPGVATCVAETLGAVPVMSRKMEIATDSVRCWESVKVSS
jgi:hypothetical protein